MANIAIDLFDENKVGCPLNDITIYYMHPIDKSIIEEQARQNDDEFHGGYVKLQEMITILNHHGYRWEDIRDASDKIKKGVKQ